MAKPRAAQQMTLVDHSEDMPPSLDYGSCSELMPEKQIRDIVQGGVRTNRDQITRHDIRNFGAAGSLSCSRDFRCGNEASQVFDTQAQRLSIASQDIHQIIFRQAKAFACDMIRRALWLICSNWRNG